MTGGVGGSLLSDLKSLVCLIFGVQAQFGALCACPDRQDSRQAKQDARLEEIIKTNIVSSESAQKGPKKRMLQGAHLCNRECVGRNGQKDNALELRRFNALCNEERVDTSSLMMVDRCGKLLALRFFSSLGARVFEQEFKNIEDDGDGAYLWSGVTKGAKGTRIQIIPNMIGGPAKIELLIKTLVS